MSTDAHDEAYYCMALYFPTPPTFSNPEELGGTADNSVFLLVAVEVLSTRISLIVGVSRCRSG